MKKRISKLGYEVDQKIVSPIDFNIPQSRNRMYIVAKKNKLNGFTWPKKLKPKKSENDKNHALGYNFSYKPLPGKPLQCLL